MHTVILPSSAKALIHVWQEEIDDVKKLLTEKDPKKMRFGVDLALRTHLISPFLYLLCFCML